MQILFFRNSALHWPYTCLPVITPDLVASFILAYMQAIDNTYATPHMLFAIMWPVLQRQQMIWEHPLRISFELEQARF